jgi:hypothetical protein
VAILAPAIRFLCRILAGFALLYSSLATAAAQSSIFPLFQSESSGYAGLSIVNNGEQVREAAITWTSPDGKSSRTGRLILGPGVQRAYLLRDILQQPVDPGEGWISINAAGKDLLSYLTVGAEGKLDGTDAVQEPAAEIFLDFVKINTGFVELDHTDTSCALVNPGGNTANAKVELIGLEGKSVAGLTFAVPAFGSLTIRLSEAFRELLPAGNAGGRRFDGYARIVADTGIAVWCRIDTPVSMRLLRGRSRAEMQTTESAIGNHFASGGASLYRSTLNLVNPGDSTARLELVAMDDRGQIIGSKAELSLNPGQGIREDILSLFRVVQPAVYPPPFLTGYIRVRSSGGNPAQVAGDVDIRSEGRYGAALFPITPAPAREWMLPFAVSNADYYTGYVIVNTNELLTVQTEVSVELLDKEGRPAGSLASISLSPSARFVGLLDREISSGYLRIRASGPITVAGSIGACNGSLFAFLPAK